MSARRSSPRTASGSLVGFVAVLLLAGVAWFVQGGPSTDPQQHAGPGASASSSAGPSSGSSTDPASGLPWVAAGDLPPEARETLRRIDAGGPYPYPQDDEVFGNFEGVLPEEPRGYYREYTVETPGSADRGARRIVTGDGGQLYWTGDHYASFARIRR